MTQHTLVSVLKEDRHFSPTPDFQQAAIIADPLAYEQLRKQAAADPVSYWDSVARQDVDWFRTWTRTLDWNPPHANWFVGGTTNVSHNCLDRHLDGPRKNKAALIWEGEPGEQRVLTYQMLHREVCKFSNVLKSLGLTKGDRVAIYLPLIPEAAIAMLACARVGLVHTVVFAGFSAEVLRDRIQDAAAKAIITADGGFRRGAIVPLKQNSDEAARVCPTVQHCVVVRRTCNEITMVAGRDHYWDDLMDAAVPHCPAEHLDSEHPLYILYTSGTTGKPKGLVHTTGGYLTHITRTAKWIFDLKETDTYWCTADVGWVTGHSYVVYGILSNGATTVMYEGAPNHPDPGRFWNVIDRYGVTIFYTAPTAIRAFMKWGERWPRRHNLTSLRLLGTVGEPINPEAWMWYRSVIGQNRCPIVDTWWQTETGGIMISPVPGVTPTKPGSATLPLPGVVADVVTRAGETCGPDAGGFLVLRHPWPGMARTIFGDPERYYKTYWSEIPGMYFAGDGARKDADGYFWIMGRVDDVVNVSGHRLGTMEIESALVSHPSVVEAAVVGPPDDLKGQKIVAFVTLESEAVASTELVAALKEHVVKEIGALARPDDIRFTDSLPKTRSGKIMRRLLLKITTGSTAFGDTTTLEDRAILDKLKESFDED